MNLTDKEKCAINNFFDAVKKLREMRIFRSDRYLGELGEFLASKRFNLNLATNKKQKGHDTEGWKNPVQIKFHNSPTRTNIDLGDPKKYKKVIVVLGPNSMLNPKGCDSNQFAFYIFTSAQVDKSFHNKKSFSCGKKKLGKPQDAISLQIMKKPR